MINPRFSSRSSYFGFGEAEASIPLPQLSAIGIPSAASFWTMAACPAL